MMTYFKKLVLAGALSVGLMSITGGAEAITINNGSHFLVNWNSSGRIASADFSVTNMTTSSVKYHIILTNASSITDTLTAFSFNMNPNPTSATDTSSLFNTVLGVSFDGNTVSVCMYTGSTCGGNAATGVATGSNSGYFDLTLNFTSPHLLTGNPLSATMNTFVARFQNTSTNQQNDDDCTTIVDYVNGTTTVMRTPEPEALSLLLLGGVGLYVAKRRRG